MKQTKTFRLSADIIDYLKQKDNASTYLERIINLDRQTPDNAPYLKQSSKEGVLTIEYLDKQFSRLENIIKTNGRGTSYTEPIKQKVYNGKFLVGMEDVKPKDCTCPYEINERGLNERAGTNEECPIHGDLTNFEDLL